MGRDSISYDTRSTAQRRQHYGVEKELAGRLRNSTRQERRQLYTAVYEELYRRVPDHPLLTRPASSAETDRAVAMQMKLIKPFLSQETTFLEIGAGDCALSAKVAQFTKLVYGVEISDNVAGHTELPRNFQFVFSDGSSVPVPPNSVDVAYSNHVMEHLHVEDAFEQLKNVYNALVPGGVYVCVTPNRLNGPHDISMYFDNVANGLHLKEYSIKELNELFSEVGFSRTRACAEIRGVSIRLSVPAVVFCEGIVDRLPRPWGRAIARLPFIRKLLGIQLVGTK